MPACLSLSNDCAYELTDCEAETSPADLMEPCTVTLTSTLPSTTATFDCTAYDLSTAPSTLPCTTANYEPVWVWRSYFDETIDSGDEGRIFVYADGTDEAFEHTFGVAVSVSVTCGSASVVAEMACPITCIHQL
jgi:hypothetical protein